MNLGKWKSKTTELVVNVIKIDNDAVWYEHPAWGTLQNCAKDVFLGSMIRLQEDTTFVQFRLSEVDFDLFGL